MLIADLVFGNLRNFQFIHERRHSGSRDCYYILDVSRISNGHIYSVCSIRCTYH